MDMIMTDLAQWEKENEAFLIKIGQVAPKAETKPTPKKDEE
jgi:hypothetical protein